MTASESNQVVDITVTKFPQNLLIPNVDNVVSLDISNNSNKQETFKFGFEGENLNISFDSKEFTDEVIFNPGEKKHIDLKLIPTADGYGKLTINAYWMQVVQYTVKIQKIRDTISSSNIKKILNNVESIASDSVDKFKAKNFFIEAQKNEIQKLEKEINSLGAEYQTFAQSGDIFAESSKSNIFLEKIDMQVKDLAKKYLSNNQFYKALEAALKLSKESEKIEFYYDLIRAYATVDLDACLKVVKSLNDNNKKLEITNKLALDFIESDHDNIIKIFNIIENPSERQDLIVKVLGNILKKNYQLAIKLTYLIKDNILKVKVLFNVLKNLRKGNNNEEILRIVNQINQIILNSSDINLRNQNFQNPAYEFFKNSICILAELDCPETADHTIKTIQAQDVREKIAKDIFNVIYYYVDEIRTKIEPKIIFSQFYLLNVFSSKITDEVKEFALIGGNVSNNLLTQDYNFTAAFLLLFGYDFSIFPIIDRIYSDLKFNQNKSIAYYIFPARNQHNEEELAIIQNTLRLFLPSNKISNQVYIFNLDFITYLGKPTIILASDIADLNILKSKIDKKLGNSVEVLVDDLFFEGGESSNNLKNIYSSYNFKLINLILSYEFLNDFNVFRAFIGLFT